MNLLSELSGAESGGAAKPRWVTWHCHIAMVCSADSHGTAAHRRRHIKMESGVCGGGGKWVPVHGTAATLSSSR